MNIVKASDPDTLEYTNLLVKRDALKKEAVSIRIEYLQLFGDLMVKNYRAKVECIRCKKIIAFIQAALNRGEQPDRKEMLARIQKEMEVYRDRLLQMQEDAARAAKAERSSAEDVEKSKQIYRRLAKRLHPDICRETGSDGPLKELWLSITEAYYANDAKLLSELEILANRLLTDMGRDGLQIDIPDIKGRIIELRAEIEEIMTTEPWILRYIIEDPEETENKTAELKEETEAYLRHAEELQQVIDRLQDQGG
ncbi:MAG: hypothetical protein IK083_09985 [Abditibacteriota bacterium]|nr:hypothetical protein [Abditibacteriota bacterium]